MHGGVETARVGLEPTLSRAMQLHFDESPGDFGIGRVSALVGICRAAAVTAGAANLPRAL